jgi:hypothetical protein
MCRQKKEENSTLTQGSEGCVNTIICTFFYVHMCPIWKKLREIVQMLSSVKALLVTLYWGSIEALLRLF